VGAAGDDVDGDEAGWEGDVGGSVIGGWKICCCVLGG
jgi:hypothetical protein